MSYILEALRRADAERQRGGVPGLHAQPSLPSAAAQSTAPDGPASGAGRVLRIALPVAILVALLALAWWLVRDHPADLPLAGVGAVPQTPPVTAPAASPLLSTTPAAQTPPGATPARDAAPVVPPILSPAPAVAIAPLAAAPAAPLASAAAALAPPAMAASAPRTAQTPVLTATAVAPPAARPAASVPDPITPLAALPEALRGSLPRLSWSGAVYSDRPEQRLVVVNGQVAREGDELAAGLRLERIGPRTAVVRWRGQRIELPL